MSAPAMLAITALIIWIGGLLAVVITATFTYIDTYDPDERRDAARLIIFSPLWPLLLLQFLMQVYRDAFGSDHDRA